MREFVFELLYQQAASPLEKLFGETTEVTSTGVGGSIETDEFWRLERFTGDVAEIDVSGESQFERLLEAEGITPEPCTGSLHTEVLKRTESETEVYYHLQDIANCESVATLAVEYIGPDVLFEVERNRERETWTVMMETEDGVGLFYDALQVSLRPGVRFEFGHIGQATDRRTALFARKNLPAEQRDALVTAVQNGYYEKPRQTTLEELADQLECPRSTLSYRLRSAESKLAKAFAIDEQSTGLESFPQTPDTEGKL